VRQFGLYPLWTSGNLRDLSLVREDRDERTSGVSVVPPGALLSSYSTDQISAESILSAKLTSRLDFPMRTLKDDQVDRRKVEAR